MRSRERVLRASPACVRCKFFTGTQPTAVFTAGSASKSAVFNVGTASKSAVFNAGTASKNAVANAKYN